LFDKKQAGAFVTGNGNSMEFPENIVNFANCGAMRTGKQHFEPRFLQVFYHQQE
jgi:hypothetical protein